MPSNILLAMSAILSVGIAILAYRKAVVTKKLSWKVASAVFALAASLKILALLLT